MRKYLPIVIFGLLIVLLVDLIVILSTLSLRIGQKRLEDNLVIAQTTQFELLQQIASKSATISGKVK